MSPRQHVGKVWLNSFWFSFSGAVLLQGFIFKRMEIMGPGLKNNHLTAVPLFHFSIKGLSERLFKWHQCALNPTESDSQHRQYANSQRNRAASLIWKLDL